MNVDFADSVPKNDELTDEESLLFVKNWYAIHTKSKHEKLISQLCSKRQIEAYLPVRKILKKWSDRKKMIEFPLFPGYIFVNICLNEKNNVLNLKGVVRILGGSVPEIIPFEQLETLRKFEAADVEVDPYLHLKPGNLVKVIKGPFRGSTGFLVRKQSKYRLCVNIKLIMQSASVEIDASDVEKI